LVNVPLPLSAVQVVIDARATASSCPATSAVRTRANNVVTVGVDNLSSETKDEER
jgi:hypothetical protein